MNIGDQDWLTYSDFEIIIADDGSDVNTKILIVDDNEDLLRAAKMYLKRHFHQVDIEKNPESIPTLLNNEQYDVILLAVAHDFFKALDYASLKISPDAIVYDTKAFLDRSIVTARL